MSLRARDFVNCQLGVSAPKLEAHGLNQRKSGGLKGAEVVNIRIISRYYLVKILKLKQFDSKSLLNSI